MARLLGVSSEISNKSNYHLEENKVEASNKDIRTVAKKLHSQIMEYKDKDKVISHYGATLLLSDISMLKHIDDVIS